MRIFAIPALLQIWIISIVLFSLCTQASSVPSPNIGSTIVPLNELRVNNTPSIHLDNDTVKSYREDTVNATAIKEIHAYNNESEIGNNPSSPGGNQTGANIRGLANNINNTLDNNSTYNSTQNTSQSKLNLAIIPGLAVLVLVIAVCIKCCTCFREYTRAGDKDDTNNYFSIIQDDDDDYGHIDMLSESASTCYYDTVSSYCSFLRRSGNENTFIASSMKSLPLDGIRCSSGTPRKDIHRKILREINDLSSKTKSETIESPKSCTPRSDSVLSDCARTISVSSEDADPLSASMSDSADFGQNRKLQRFKVSFVTENSQVPERVPLQPIVNSATNTPASPVVHTITGKRSNLKKLPMGMYDRSRTRSCSMYRQTIDYCAKGVKLKSPQKGITNDKRVHSVDASTQTTKSFLYNLWKGRRRHFSDSGVDECINIPTIHELTSMCSDVGIYSRPITADKVKKTGLSQLPHICEKSASNFDFSSAGNTNNIGKIARFYRREKSLSEFDSSDDVFVTCDSTTALKDNSNILCDIKVDSGRNVICSYKKGSKGDILSDDTNSNDRTFTDDFLIHSDIKSDYESYPSEKSCNKDGVDKKATPVDIVNPVCDEFTDPKTVNESYVNVQIHSCRYGDTCNSCFIRTNEHCKPHPLSQTTDIKAITEMLSEKNCSKNTYSTESVKGDGNIPKFERNQTLISEDITSSLTSLESSGYAEISSDSSYSCSE